MARFHVHANAEGGGLLLDVQANLLSHLNTCVVVPLLPLQQAPKPAKVLNPVFEIDGANYLMTTQFLANVPLVARLRPSPCSSPPCNPCVA